MENEYLEFTVHDVGRFDELVAFFNRLKADKEGDGIQESEAYLHFIDEAARAYFWWPTEAEYDTWLQDWYATPLPERWTVERLKRPWMFEAMIDAFDNGEYSLRRCALIATGIARLEFFSYAYPYGGVGCMKALIEAFGFKVTEISDGASPPRRV
jgi:hypothetical protein